MPLVSVCMQTWNSERFIGEAIESVLGQDFEDLELIIVDGASTDKTKEIIERYARQDLRIRAIFHERNLGSAKACNDGIESAKGEFIAQIDSDDVWLPDKLTKQLAILERDEDLVVWSEGEIIDDAGHSTGRTYSQRIENNVYYSAKKSGHLWPELLQSNFIFHSSVIYKKGNLGNVRYDEALVALIDFKFLLELAGKYEFYYIAEPLAKYRIHGGNTFVSSSSEALRRQRLANKEYILMAEDALQQHRNELTRKTQAVVYGRIGLQYYNAGEMKKSLSFFSRAFICNPFERRNLRCLEKAFRRVLRESAYAMSLKERPTP